MKTSLVFRLSVLLVLLTAMMPLPVHADDDALRWTKVDKPGLGGNIIVSPSEVSEIAVGRQGTIYAVDSEYSRVYQSTNAGATWQNINSRLTDAGAVLPAGKIAIAPDTNNVVTVVTDAGTKVYLSTDGGTTWTGSAIPGMIGTIQCITISRQYVQDGVSQRDIAIGTAVWGDVTSTGQLWVLRLGSVSSWRNQNITVDPALTGAEVSSIAYSPGFQRDNTIVAVASTGNDVAAAYRNKTWLCVGIRNTGAGTTSWNSLSGYPVEIGTAASLSAGDAVGASVSSSLALPSNYSATDEDLRKLFVSYNRNPNASDDVYRFDDISAVRLNTNGGAVIDFSSIAYSGTTTAGTLLAGDVNPIAGSPTVRVRRTTNPFAASPTWLLSAIPPSGPGNAKVIWSPEGDSAYCGTSQSPGAALDESAISTSSDGGDNWQQLSLINTTIKLSDVTPAPDSKTVFVATYSAFGPEGIWRTASTGQGIGTYWSRQLTMATVSNGVILRLSPNYASDYTIYAIEAGGNQVAVSHNRGNTWKRRLAPDGVIDVAVEDENTLCAAVPGGYVRKSTNGSFIWSEPVATGLTAINMLAIAGKGIILVGGRNGDVAYSIDGGASFTRINKTLTAGDVQVVADANFNQNKIIYAASNAPDKGIWRWALGSSTDWEQIDESITSLSTGQRIGGLVTDSGGTLYALRLEPSGATSGGMTRTLDPAAPNNESVEFSFSSDALPAGSTFNSALVFANALPYLKLSADSGQNDLWSIDTTGEIIYHFQDTLAARAPVAVISSANQGPIMLNPRTGRTGDIPFSWLRPSLNVTGYEIALYASQDGSRQLTSIVFASNDDTVSVLIGPYQTGAQYFEFAPGMTYYWRVRTSAPVVGPWTTIKSFTIEPAIASVPGILSPANGAGHVPVNPAFSWSPIASATEYEFILALNPSLSAPVIDVKTATTAYAPPQQLESGAVYYWAVRASSPTAGEWSAVANFKVKEKPAETIPPVIIKEMPTPTFIIPAPVVPPPVVLPTPSPAPPAPSPVAPAYVLATVIVEGILTIAVIILIIRSRRAAGSK